MEDPTTPTNASPDPGPSGYAQKYLDCLEWRWPQLVALLHRTGFHWQDAEDAAQLATIVAVRVIAAQAVERLGDRWHWLIGVALNKARDIRRSRRYRWVSLDPDALDALTVDPVAPNDDDDFPPRLGLVRSAIDRLPPNLRELFDFVYLEGHSYREAKERFNIGLGTVSRRLHETREMLRSELSGLPELGARAAAT